MQKNSAYVDHNEIYDLRKHYFSARIVNIWNSLPKSDVVTRKENLLIKDALFEFIADTEVKL